MSNVQPHPSAAIARARLGHSGKRRRSIHRMTNSSAAIASVARSKCVHSISANAPVWACHRFSIDAAMANHAQATAQGTSVPSVDTMAGLKATSVADTTAATGRRMARPAV
jgi:hypothetical protein